MTSMYCPLRIIWMTLAFIPLFLNRCQPVVEEKSETGFYQPVLYLDSLRVNGYAGDWQGSGPPFRILSDVCGKVPGPQDLQAQFRLAWNEQGLFILVEVIDDTLYEDPLKFWDGDGMELFISPRCGSFDIIQISVRPSCELPDSITDVVCYDHRRSDSLRRIPPSSRFQSRCTPEGYLLEGRIPLDAVGISHPSEGLEMAAQVYINDADAVYDSSGFSLPWYPVRDSYRNPYAFHRIRFCRSLPVSPPPEIRACLVDDQTIHLKVLSPTPCDGEVLYVRSGKYNRKFRLQPETGGICSHSWVLPARKFISAGPAFQFFLRDSMFFSLHPCLLHRVYRETEKPNRFEDEIRIFEIMDHFRPPPVYAILFTGSSTIRSWYDLERQMPGLEVLNRGFGGSTMKDLNHYLDRIVLPYHPSKIVVYEGDNDIARGASPEEFLKDCRLFVEACTSALPDADIYFISIKPSPARTPDWQEMHRANRMLEEFCSDLEKVHFINISALILQNDGIPHEDLFDTDRLHFNDKGYELLAREIRSRLYE